MIDKRYTRYSSVTVRSGNGRAHGVTNVTHPFRGVTDVTVLLRLCAERLPLACEVTASPPNWRLTDELA